MSWIDARPQVSRRVEVRGPGRVGGFLWVGLGLSGSQQCPSPGPYAARVRPTAKTKPSPVQRVGLHDPSRLLVRRDLRHCRPPVWAPDSEMLFARSTRPPKRTAGVGVACAHPRDRGGAGRVDGADDDRRDWSGVDRNGPTRSAGDSPALFGILGSARTGGHSLMKAMGFLRQRFRGASKGCLARREFRRAQLTIGRRSRQAVGPRKDSTVLT